MLNGLPSKLRFNMKLNLKSLMRGNRFLLKPFLTLLAIFALGALSIILSGAHYADDVARTNYGYPGWSAFSRYLSTLSAFVLHADRYLTNIAPLPQLIAIALLALSGLVLICLVSGKETFKKPWTDWIWKVIAVVPLGLCPYFLECLSYQYDAPYMALSILAVLIPFVFRKKSNRLYLPAIAIGTLIACMTYQASVGIFGVVLIFLIIKDWNEQKSKSLKPLLKFTLLSGGTFLLTLVVFQKFLMRPRDVYVSNEVPSLSSFFPEFFAHLRQYYALVFHDFKLLWLVLIGIILVGFIVVFALKSRQKKLLAGIIALLGVVLMAASVYAPYAALSKPLYTTRAMYAIGSLIAIAGIYIVSEKGWQKFLTAPVVILAWCFFVFSFTYGNALNEQTKFHDMQVTMAISDVNELLPTLGDGEKIIQVSGQIDYAPSIEHMSRENYELLNRLLKSTFGRSVPWMAYKLTQASGLTGLVFNPDIDFSEKDLPVLKETNFYTIQGDSEGVLVHFNGELLDMSF